MLSGAVFAQQAAGDTGSSSVDSVTVRLPAPTAAGHTLLVVVVADATVQTPAGFVVDVAQVNNDGHYVYRRSTMAGETSWTVVLNATTGACWWAAEVSGLDASPLDPASVSTGTSGHASELSIGPTGVTSQADVLLLASIGTSAGTTPGATVTAWTTGFVPLATTATTRPTGTNVGLGVAALFPGQVGVFETTATTQFAAHTGALTVYRGAPPSGQRDMRLAASPPVAAWHVLAPRQRPRIGTPAARLQAGDPR